MKKGLTDILVIVDASGSMAGTENDVTGTFNAFVEEQKRIPGEARISVCFFNEVCRIQWWRKLLTELPALLREEYIPGGSTALIDTACSMVDRLGDSFQDLPEKERPEKVLLAILTDGEENASRQYKIGDLRRRIEHQTTKYGWSFIFLSANIDAFTVAESYGISALNTVQFNSSADMARCCLQELSVRASSYRAPLKEKEA